MRQIGMQRARAHLNKIERWAKSTETRHPDSIAAIKPNKCKRLCIKCIKNEVFPAYRAAPSEKICDECSNNSK